MHPERSTVESQSLKNENIAFVYFQLCKVIDFLKQCLELAEDRNEVKASSQGSHKIEENSGRALIHFKVYILHQFIFKSILVETTLEIVSNEGG